MSGRFRGVYSRAYLGKSDGSSVRSFEKKDEIVVAGEPATVITIDETVNMTKEEFVEFVTSVVNLVHVQPVFLESLYSLLKDTTVPSVKQLIILLYGICTDYDDRNGRYFKRNPCND